MPPEPTSENACKGVGLAPIYAGILVGGGSTRMGSPKHLLRAGDQTFLETVRAAIEPHVERVVILGAGELPERCRQLTRLPDVPDLAGPLAGILAAIRWNPDVAWLIAACDMPLITSDAVAWLLTQRAPDHIAILPRVREGKPRREGEAPAEPDVAAGPRTGRPGADPTAPSGSAGASPSQTDARRVEPLLAVYEPAALPALEALAASKLRAPHRMAEHDAVFTPTPPPELADAWRNVNTPADLERSD